RTGRFSQLLPFDGFLLLTCADGDGAHQALRLMSDEIDRQEAVGQIGRAHLDAVREHERALELARGDAAVKIVPLAVVDLFSADDELLVLDRDVELAARK